MSAAHTPRLLAGACLLAVCLSPTSCRRDAAPEHLTFPPTPVLSVRSTWAVVISPLLRVRQEPSSRSEVLQHIRMGVVVEVIGRSDLEDQVEGQADYWYRINYDGLKGWVFGIYLAVRDSRASAEAEAARLQ